ncbi:MAG: hypothetical protein ABJB10_04565 [Mesorhizobium sp.]
MQNHPPLGGLRSSFYVNVKLCHADFAILAAPDYTAVSARSKATEMRNQQTPADHLDATPDAAPGIVHLSAEDQLALAEAVVSPPEPNEALRRAAAAYDRLVAESR